MHRTNGWPTLALEPLMASDASWSPVQTFPAQAPSSAGLGARGMPFSQTLAIMDRLREECRVVLVARSRGQVDRLLALLREHDVPAYRVCVRLNVSRGFGCPCVAMHAHAAKVGAET